MKNKKFSILGLINEKLDSSFEYIKDSEKFIYFAIGVFSFFAIVGFLVPLPPDVSKQILDYFKKIVEETKGFGLVDLIAFLFSNNSASGFMALFLGFFFGIFPFFNAVVNGIVLGVVANMSVSENGVFSLWRLFPHGVFELPAIFISFGLGLKFSTFVLKKNKLETFKEFLEKSFWSYLLIVIPLLIVAAIIEGTLIYLGV